MTIIQNIPSTVTPCAAVAMTIPCDLNQTMLHVGDRYTYQNQEQSCQVDSNTSTEPVNAESKEEHAEDVTNEDGVGQPGLDFGRHLLWVSTFDQ